MEKLGTLGISKCDTRVKSVGNYWRELGRQVLVLKKISVPIKDLELLDKLLGELDSKGIEYVSLEGLTNSRLQEFRKDVKIEALQAAKAKAQYLAESLGRKLGKVTVITEKTDNNWFGGWHGSNVYSNSVLPANGGGNPGNLRQIKLQYEISA